MDKVEVILDKLVAFFDAMFAFVERAMKTLGIELEDAE